MTNATLLGASFLALLAAPACRDSDNDSRTAAMAQSVASAPREEPVLGVCQSDGMPASGADIYVEVNDRIFHTRTNALGEFRLEGVPPGNVLIECSMAGRRVEVEHDPRLLFLDSCEEEQFKDPACRGITLDLQDLAPSGQVVVAVQTPNGEPVPSAEVDVWAWEDDAFVGPEYRGETNARGLFRFRSHHSRLSLNVQASEAMGSACAGHAESELTLPLDEEAEPEGAFHTVVMPLRRVDMKPLVVRVLGQDGRPISGILVHPVQKVPADCWGGNLETESTDALGTFSFSAVTSATYLLQLYDPQFEHSIFEVRTSKSPTEIRLSRSDQEVRDLD